MMRLFLAIVGLITAIVPEKMVGMFEDAFIENPEDARRSATSLRAIRAEGVLVLIASVLGGRAYTAMWYITGIAGSILVVVPQAYRIFANAVIFEDPSLVRWHPGYTRVVRAIGLMYVVLCIWQWRNRRDNQS